MSDNEAEVEKRPSASERDSLQKSRASDVDSADTPKHDTEAAKDQDVEYPGGWKLAMIMTSVLASLFLVALDRTIIATAVPRITDQFNSLDDVSWYAGAYLITSCATQLLWGRIFTFYNTKTVSLVAIVIFEIGSALCGAAPNSPAFIVGRAIAGIGSAAIYSGTTVIITKIIPLQKRPIWMGFMGMVFGVSSVVGPLLGGAFTDNVSWRWCFYINLPIGGAAFAVMLFFLHIESEHVETPPRRQFIRLDPLGTIVFLPSIICLLLALQWGGVQYPWSNGRVIALFVVFGVLLIAFIGIQLWRQEDATLPPRIIRQRSVAAGSVFVFCLGGGMITMLYYIAIWFQAVKGVSAVKSGIDTIPMVLALVVAAIISGGVVKNKGHYMPFFYISTIFMAVGAGLITTFKPDTNHSAWIGYQVLFGFGIGCGMQQPSMAAQNVLSKADVSIGVSVMFFANSLGGAVFVSVASTVFNNYLTSKLSNIPGIDAQGTAEMGATQLRNLIPADKLGQVIVVYNDAVVKAFIVATAVSAFMIVPALCMEWKRLPPMEHGGKKKKGWKGKKGKKNAEPEPTDQAEKEVV